MKTIAVLFGGASFEYEVSLKSSYSIISYINQQIYNIILIGITKEGRWYRFNGDIEKIKNDTWKNRVDTNKLSIHLDPKNPYFIEHTKDKDINIMVDAVFPVLHGKNGEDGTIQGLFSFLQIPIIGCDLASSSLCMDKYRSHLVCQALNIKVPKSTIIHHYDEEDTYYIKAKEIGYPIFIKPLKAGSSFGISKATNKQELKSAIKKAFHYDNVVTLEETIYGFEVGCAIIGNKQLTIGDVDEIEIQSSFFDYKEKYTLETSKIHLPARIDESLKKQVKETAIKIYKALGCTTFARVDMFINENQEIIFNEVNTIPGFTDHSRFPNMLKAVGYRFDQIIEMIIEEGLYYESH